MKVYIWEDVYPVKYGQADIVIAAIDEPHAREILTEALRPYVQTNYSGEYKDVLTRPPKVILSLGGYEFLEWKE